MQGLEIRDGRVIFYDTGDFLDDYWVFPFFRTDRSCLFLLRIVDGRIAGVRLVPVTLQPGVVRRAIGREGQAIIAKMLRRSRPFLGAGATTAIELDLSVVSSEQTAAHAVAPAGGREAMLTSVSGLVPRSDIWSPSNSPAVNDRRF
jgi:hypothetical protein